MSPEHALLAKIEILRTSIDDLRQDIWGKDQKYLPTDELECQLEDLLIVYLHYIREHERMAS